MREGKSVSSKATVESKSVKRRKPVKLLVCHIVMLGILMTGRAASDTFVWVTDGNGDWNDSANWIKLSGSSARTFPNDTSDTAHITNALSSALTIRVPGTYSVGELRVGDPSHLIVFSGTGTLQRSSTMHWYIANAGTVRFDINVTVISGTLPNLYGSSPGGVLIINTNSTFHSPNRWRLYSNLTLRVWGKINANSSMLSLSDAGTRLEIGRDDFSNVPQGINFGPSTEFAPIGGHRRIDRSLTMIGIRNLLFDGSTGYNLETSGDAFISTPAGTGSGTPCLLVSSSRLTIGGRFGFAAASVGDRDFHRHPIRLINDGALELANLATNYQVGADLVIDGTGTLLLNNAIGSATASNNTLVVGRKNHISSTQVYLGGTGSTDSALIIGGGGILDPGNGGAGTLTINSNVTFEAGAKYRWERNGSQTDLLVVQGDLTINDDFEIQVVQQAADGRSAIDIITYTGGFTGDPSKWTLTPPSGAQGFGNLAVEDTGTSIRLTGLPAPSAGTLIQIR